MPTKPPKVALVSLGCPKNLIDSEKMLATLAEGGCVGRYFGQAPEVDSACLLKRRRTPGRFHRVKVVGWKGYDLIVD
jgi:hypothetical protein